MALTVEVVSRENVVWTGEASYVRVRTMKRPIWVFIPDSSPPVRFLRRTENF